MGTNDIVLKARQLNEAYDCDGVVELLKDYVKKNSDDTEAFALYQKNSAMKMIVDLDVDTDELYAVDETNIYNSIPENIVLQLSEILFIEQIANVYLGDHTDEERKNIVFGYLKRGIVSLGERLNDYDTLKNQLEKFHKALKCYGYEKKFYYYLELIVDWRSKVSENILLFLVETAKSLTAVVTDQKIYDDYTKDMKTNVFPFSDKPQLSGDKLVIVNIKSQEAKDFWKGYFALVKRIRQEEYDTYKQIVGDENHELHEVYLIGKNLHEISMKKMMNKMVSPSEFAKMQVATGCHMIAVSESAYKGRIEDAEKSYNTVKVNPIEQIKQLISKLLGKK